MNRTAKVLRLTPEARNERIDREVAFMGAVGGHPARAVAYALNQQTPGIDFMDSTKAQMAKCYADDIRLRAVDLTRIKRELGATPREIRIRDRNLAACRAHALQMQEALQKILGMGGDAQADIAREVLIRIEVTAAKVEL